MTIEIPCFVGDTVFADLRENQKKKPTYCDLTECYIKSIEIDDCYKEPLFTAVRKEFGIWHPREKDYSVFFLDEFGKSIFTKEQYFKTKG